MQMQQQTYPTDHVIYVNSPHEATTSDHTTLNYQILLRELCHHLIGPHRVQRTASSCRCACSRASWCRRSPSRLLVDREDHGMGRRIDVEPDHVAQLADELGIVGELELLDPMRLQAMCAPDALYRADADPDFLGHHGAGPVGRLGRRIGEHQRDHALGHIRAQRRNARGPRSVAQQAVAALLREAFLPAPDAGRRLASPAHDLVGTDAISAEEDDLSPRPKRIMKQTTLAISRMSLRRACGPSTPWKDSIH